MGIKAGMISGSPRAEEELDRENYFTHARSSDAMEEDSLLMCDAMSEDEYDGEEGRCETPTRSKTTR